MYAYHLNLQNLNLQRQLNQQNNGVVKVRPVITFNPLLQRPVFLGNQIVLESNDNTVNTNNTNITTNNHRIKYMTSTNDSIDSTIRNAVLIVQIYEDPPNGQAQQKKGDIIIVRETKSKKWMLPGGKIDNGETPFEAARREFLEETSFSTLIESKIVFPIIVYNHQHSTGSVTRIFKVSTKQVFGTFTTTNETDKLLFANKAEIRKKISKIDFRQDNQKSITQLISYGVI